MFLESHVLLVLAFLVLVMNALGLGFTLIRGHRNTAGQSDHADNRSRTEKRLVASN